MEQCKNNKLNRKIDFFKSIPIFSELTRDAIAKFTYFFHQETIARNACLYHEGDILAYLYIVINGEFELSVKADYVPNSLAEHKNVEYLKSSMNRFYEDKRDQIKDKYLKEMNYLISKNNIGIYNFY